MTAPLRVTVVPLVGPFHTRFPLYNVVHVRALVGSAAPDAVALATLAPGALSQQGWQSTSEIALPHTVVPWALAQGVPTFEVGSVPGSPGEPGNADDAASFQRYLSEFEAGRAHLRKVQAALRPVEELLGAALDLGRILTQLLPALNAYDADRRLAFGEGPGTGWQAERARRMADRVLSLEHQHVVLLAGVDDIGALMTALSERVEVLVPDTPVMLSEADAEAARARSLLDVAMRGDVDDPASLLAQLRSMDEPEARYHEANVLLAHGHAAEALELLSGVAAGNFHEPYYLPGYVLARLGQLKDMAGDRTAALRAYRGVLALSYAPPEAAEAARTGLEAPFDPHREQAPT